MAPTPGWLDPERYLRTRLASEQENLSGSASMGRQGSRTPIAERTEKPMNTRTRKANLLALFSLLVVFLLSGLAACGGPAATQPQPTLPQPGALSVITTYFQIF